MIDERVLYELVDAMSRTGLQIMPNAPEKKPTRFSSPSHLLVYANPDATDRDVDVYAEIAPPQNADLALTVLYLPTTHSDGRLTESKSRFTGYIAFFNLGEREYGINVYRSFATVDDHIIPNLESVVPELLGLPPYVEP